MANDYNYSGRLRTHAIPPDIYEKHEGESPEKVLFSDKPLLATVVIWAFLLILIVYFINPS